MSAKKGCVRSYRLLGCLMAVALVASALLASSASAMKPVPTPTKYIALGDSLSFGYKGATFKANQTANKEHCKAGVEAAEKAETELAYAEKALCEPTSTFEEGFVGYFGGKLAKAEKKAGHTLSTLNLGCPGETSDGLIGHLLGGTPEAEYDPCAYHNALPAEGFPLKVEYGHSTSQLEYLLSQIKEAGEPGGTPISAISLQIGSNDELHVLYKCLASSYQAEHGFTSTLQCAEHEAGPEGFFYEGGLIHHIIANIGTTIGAIRSNGYAGKIVLLGFYNPDATVLLGSDKLVEILNQTLESEISGEEPAFGKGLVLARPYALVNPEGPLFKEGETEKETKAKIKKESLGDLQVHRNVPGRQRSAGADRGRPPDREGLQGVREADGHGVQRSLTATHR